MAYDPVLERDMFRPKSRGVVSLDDTNEAEVSDDLKARRERAQAMVDAAKEKFDPKNFQTLTEQERPGVFRPVAVNMPAPQQTVSTTQRMQQMAAQGVPPVGMADGGEVSNFMDAPDTISPTISPDSTSVGAIQALGSRIRSINSMPGSSSNLNVPVAETPEPVTGVYDSGVNRDDPKTWTDEDILKLAREDYEAELRGFKESTAKTPLGRGIQSLNPIRRTPDIQRNIERLKDIRDKTIAIGSDRRQKSEDEMKRVGEVARQSPGPSPLEEISAEDAARKEQRSREAVEFAMTPEAAGQETFGGPTTRGGGIKEIPSSGSSDNNLGIPAPEKAAGITGLVADAVSPSRRMSGAEDAASIVNLPSRRMSGAEDAASIIGGTNKPTPLANPAKGGASNPELPELGNAGPTDMNEIKAQRARDREENFNLALMQAGLGIMAGKSSNPFANIGEGAQTGLRSYTEGEQASRRNMRESIADLRAQQQMAQTRAYQNAILGNESKRLGMEEQKTQLALDAAQTSKDEFAKTLDYKVKSDKAALDSAIASRDAKMIESAASQLKDTRNTIIQRQTALMTAAQVNLMDRDAVKAELAELKQKLADADADYAYVQSKLGINLPSANKPNTNGTVQDPFGIRGRNG